MKSFHIVALAAVAALAAASGCSDDVQKTTYSGSSGFGFAASVLNVEVGSANANQILVPIYRGSEDAQIAELKFEYDISKAGASEPYWSDADPAGIFSLTTQRVIFADGAKVAYAQVRFTNLDLLGITTKYKMRLTIKDSLSPSKRSQVTMSVSRQLTFDYLGKCDYRDACVFDGTYKAEDSTESSIAIAPAHAVMLEGVIYYDTCTVSGTDVKAAPDGTITSTVDSDSFPTEDGQSNFGTGYAYRYGSENGTLEVQIDGEWWIFAANQ